MKKMNKKGFTIVELVIVIAVIAILAAVMIPTFSGIVDKANNSAALQEARSDYTEYMADFDYANGTPSKNIVFKTEKGQFVAVVDGKMISTIYDSAKDAKAAYEGETVTIGAETTDTIGTIGEYTYCTVTFADADDSNPTGGEGGSGGN